MIIMFYTLKKTWITSQILIKLTRRNQTNQLQIFGLFNQKKLFRQATSQLLYQLSYQSFCRCRLPLRFCIIFCNFSILTAKVFQLQVVQYGLTSTITCDHLINQIIILTNFPENTAMRCICLNCCLFRKIDLHHQGDE